MTKNQWIEKLELCGERFIAKTIKNNLYIWAFVAQKELEKTQMKKLITICAVVTVLAIGSAAQATIVIDDYSSPAAGWTLNAVTLGVPVTKSETGLSGVYGSTRDTVYTVSGTGLFGTSMTMGYGWCAQNNGSSSWSKATLTYNGGGAGGLGLDLTSGTEFSVDTWFDHVGNGKNSVLSLTLNDGSQTATVSKIWTTYQAIGDYGTETFSFTDFLSANPSLNLSSIDSIELYLETDMAGDYAMVTGLTTDAVPEPATVFILGLGALSLIRRKR
jgi:hypothetical protein